MIKKISLVITTLNEEKTISSLLTSIINQTRLPDELVVVDAKSKDMTVKLIKKFASKYVKRLEVKVLVKEGNRSIGRNLAIKNARYQWLAITDAGCILDKDWLKELILKQEETKSEVVAGYYNAKPETSFEEAVVPYVLVMPDKVNDDNFLPATRSMLISKKEFNKVGKFDESLSLNEDYAFAKKLTKIAFTKKAVITWLPRTNLKEFNIMIYNFAKGDIQAGIIRPKVVLIFIRYLVAVILLFTTPIYIPTILGMLYLTWSIQKNYRYVKKGWYYLPILQISSDIAVMLGSMSG